MFLLVMFTDYQRAEPEYFPDLELFCNFTAVRIFVESLIRIKTLRLWVHQTPHCHKSEHQASGFDKISLTHFNLSIAINYEPHHIKPNIIEVVNSKIRLNGKT